MDRWQVAQTHMKGLRRLGVGGRQTQDSWHQIAAYLQRVRGEGKPILFAEPVLGPEDKVNWYANGAGEPRPLDDLPPEERERLLSKFEEEYAAIKALAEDLLRHKDAPQRRLGAVLNTALEFAQVDGGEQPLHSVDGSPVLVNWGTRLDVPERSADPLRDFVDKARQRKAAPVEPEPAPPPIVTPVEPVLVRERWVLVWNRDWFAPLLWLLLALLVAWLFFLLLAPCGVAGFTGERHCPGVFERAQSRTQQLEAEIASLEAVLERAPPCGDEFERRREQAGVSKGAVTATLIWQGIADLDLSVICPDGATTIWFDNKQACGGVFEADANARSNSISPSPMEHIVFSQTPSGGKFRVQVHKFVKHKCPLGQTCPAWYPPGPVNYEVQIVRDGKTETFKGSVTDDQKTIVTEF